ncbi:MAG: NTP transferase domain-containing protein [Candidatus Methanoperedens sp.]|nr:NTP transferase domain-containing protein [Candidatus Methanoperedens sp.]MCE8427587.1 NTP transferase domain-containing protein [Candidatus Methanoperedens sp.]
MKAVILAAGEGLRCRPLTLTRSKVMLPVANKPLLEYIIHAVAENGLEEFILVVGYKKERIMDYFGDGLAFGVKISYIFQNAQLGTAHAVKSVRKYVDDDFLVLNGDNLINSHTIADLLSGKMGDVTLLAVEREQTSGYGVILSEAGKVTKIMEKPKEFVSHLINAGVYIFSTGIFDEVDRTPLSESGEYAITDTIQQMIQKGRNVNMVESKNMWIDAIHSWDFLKANALILEGCEAEIKGTVENGAIIKGNVTIGENSIVRAGCYIVGPAIIGKNCDIGPNTIILPSTAIGDNTSIDSSVEINNSILMNDIRLDSNSAVSNSIIGANNNIRPHFSTETGRDIMIEMKGILHHADVLGTVIGDDNSISNRVLIKAGKMVSNNCTIEAGVTVQRHIPTGSIVI